MGAIHRIVPQSWGELLKLAALSSGAGAVIGLVLWLAAPAGPPLPNLLVPAYIGLCIGLSAVLLALPVDRRLAGLPTRRRRVAIGVLMFLAGVGGWTIAFLTLPWLTGGHWRITTHDLRAALAFAGTLGLLVGVGMYAYFTLRHRLEESLKGAHEHELAQRQLEDARAIQLRLLPPEMVSGPGYRVTTRHQAAEVVAGDFYGLFPWPGGGVGLAVADVAGKGMGASLIMATVMARLPLLARGSVSATLARLNESLRVELGPREFVALCLVCYRPDDGRLEVANAGMPDPYHLSACGGRRALVVPGPRLPLGVRSEVGYQEAELSLYPGDQILLYSDGLPETVIGSGELLGYEGLDALLPDEPAPEAWLADLFAELERLGGRLPDDDRTALILTRTQ